MEREYRLTVKKIIKQVGSGDNAFDVKTSLVSMEHGVYGCER
jgi:hypothetical protein